MTEPPEPYELERQGKRRKPTEAELDAPCTRRQMDDARRHLLYLVIIGLGVCLMLSGASSFYFSRENDRQRQQTIDDAVAVAVPKAVSVALNAAVNHERLGCRRLDVVRRAVYHVLLGATLAQVHDAHTLPRGSPQRERQLKDSHDFEHVLRKLLRSAQAFATLPPHAATLPLDKLPSTFTVNCRKAYPKPAGGGSKVADR